LEDAGGGGVHPCWRPARLCAYLGSPCLCMGPVAIMASPLLAGLRAGGVCGEQPVHGPCPHRRHPECLPICGSRYVAIRQPELFDSEPHIVWWSALDSCDSHVVVWAVLRWVRQG
jgi:hypothetical protein